MANQRLHYLGVALTASLAVNLFIGGALVGQWLNARGAPPPAVAQAAAGTTGPSVAALLAALPDDVRIDAQSLFVDHATDIRQLVASLRAAQADAAITLAAMPYDGEATVLTLDTLRRHSAALEAALHALLAEIAERLDEADRAALAVAMFRAALGGQPLV